MLKKTHAVDWGSDSPTPDQLKEFFAQIGSGRITKSRLQVFLCSDEEDISSILKDWQKFYKELFGLEIDFSKLVIPVKKKGFDRLIVVAPGMTPERLYGKCKELFPSWKWTNDNLDKIVISERTAKNSAYAVWFQNTVEADENLKNLSAYILKDKNIPGITLEERLLMELKYFKETGKHLDINNITLCAGSRCSDGSVPGVFWDDVELRVGWCGTGDCSGDLRAREAVLNS